MHVIDTNVVESNRSGIHRLSAQRGGKEHTGSDESMAVHALSRDFLC
jgi:hypothetical protein